MAREESTITSFKGEGYENVVDDGGSFGSVHQF